MGAFAKQLGTLLVGQMSGSNRKASFIVGTLRTAYVVNGVLIAGIWYAAWRNERVAPGSGEFPFPGWKKLKRKFPADRPEQELDRPAGVTPIARQTRSSDVGPSISPIAHGTANGEALRKRHPELKPAIARVAETIMLQFPELQISATTNGDHAANSYHYKGRAVDLFASKSTMDRAAKWIVQNLGSLLTEGIHNPGLSIASGKTVPSSYWGSETWAGHADHLHIAV